MVPSSTMVTDKLDAAVAAPVVVGRSIGEGSGYPSSAETPAEVPCGGPVGGVSGCRAGSASVVVSQAAAVGCCGRGALSLLVAARAAWLPPPRHAIWPGGRGAGAPGPRQEELPPASRREPREIASHPKGAVAPVDGGAGKRRPRYAPAGGGRRTSPFFRHPPAGSCQGSRSQSMQRSSTSYGDHHGSVHEARSHPDTQPSRLGSTALDPNGKVRPTRPRHALHGPLRRERPSRPATPRPAPGRCSGSPSPRAPARSTTSTTATTR